LTKTAKAKTKRQYQKPDKTVQWQIVSTGAKRDGHGGETSKQDCIGEDLKSFGLTQQDARIREQRIITTKRHLVKQGSPRKWS